MKQVTSGTTKQFLQDINDNFTELYGLSTKITYGTNSPSDDQGEDGEVYIQYE